MWNLGVGTVLISWRKPNLQCTLWGKPFTFYEKDICDINPWWSLFLTSYHFPKSYHQVWHNQQIFYRIISIFILISGQFSRLLANKWHLCCTGHWFSHQTFPFHHKKLAALLCCLAPTCHNYQTFKCYCLDLSAFTNIFVDCVRPDNRIWENDRM